jgi:hypothetical protein
VIVASICQDKRLPGMKNPSNCVVYKFGLGESLVAALVGNDPEAGGKETSKEAIQSPK